MKIYYLPLEPYEERYTAQLDRWYKTAFKRRGVEHVTVEGTRTSSVISTGRVLDAHGRSIWALTQTAQLLALWQEQPPTWDDVVFLADMFHPGYEALLYVIDQLPANARPRLFTRNWAQSVDPHDFTFAMRRWMRDYERIVSRTASGIFVASSVQVAQMHAAMLDHAPVHVVGLPFDGAEVRERSGLTFPTKKERRVLFSSRWDREKQPHFFMNLVERAQGREFAGVEWAVCTSAPRLRSNDPGALNRLHDMVEQGKITLYEGLTKQQYYRLLASSAVQFNCALQDFVSFTLLEASALGTLSVLPAYLSFPEAVNYDYRWLYAAFDVDAALGKLSDALTDSAPPAQAYPAEHNSRTIDRELDIMLGERTP